jgi:ABC-type nitrate/sulfonate/bicarbonate transport system ATPase subunit
VTSAQTSAIATVSAKPVAVSVRSVAHEFVAPGSQQRVRALDGVSLEVARGEFLCLLGPSGCGKSTLLSIVGGLLEANQGDVVVDGLRVKAPLPDKIAFVFQESTLFPWYTVAENFSVAFRYQNVARSEWRVRTMAALQSVGMESFVDHFPNQLSVGMRQRVNMARGIASGSDILLMDEPFAALDEQTRMVLGEDLSVLLARTGKTIIFVTHSLAEAVFLSDRIVVMTARPGRVKTIVTVNEPHPRSPDFMLQTRFSDLRNRCYALLREEIREAMKTIARNEVRP